MFILTRSVLCPYPWQNFQGLVLGEGRRVPVERKEGRNSDWTKCRIYLQKLKGTRLYRTQLSQPNTLWKKLLIEEGIEKKGTRSIHQNFFTNFDDFLTNFQDISPKFCDFNADLCWHLTTICRNYTDLFLFVFSARRVERGTPKRQSMVRCLVVFSARSFNKIGKTGKRRTNIEKWKTSVYDGEGGKISPSCPIWERGELQKDTESAKVEVWSFSRMKPKGMRIF